MRERLLQFLVCPQCQQPLELDACQDVCGEITSGRLVCSSGHVYRVERGVPRFASDPEDESSGQTIGSFSDKWRHNPRWGMEGASADFVRHTMLAKYGWRDSAGLACGLAGRDRVLDAGAGSGCELALLADANPSAEIIGVDISLAAEAAYENTRQFPNVHVLQADLAHVPFPPAFFDFILSEGVLHHTPDTRRSFLALASSLRSGGELCIYVYVKKPPIREFVDRHLREYTTQLDPQACWDFVKSITALGQALWRTGAEVEVPEDIAPLGIKAGRYDVQRFFYYHVMKCFWNEGLSFEENNLFNFDWYHPSFAHFHTPDEVAGWFAEAGLELGHFCVDGSGITARGVKSAR